MEEKIIRIKLVAEVRYKLRPGDHCASVVTPEEALEAELKWAKEDTEEFLVIAEGQGALKWEYEVS